MSTPKPPSLVEGAAKFLDQLKSRSEEVRIKGARQLRVYVEAEARELSGETFSRLMQELNRKISELINSSDSADKIGGIMAIDTLIDVECEDKATLVTRFANFLRMIMPNPDVTIMVMASKALGHLARSGGTLTADFVEFEVKRVLEWLQGDRVEIRRHAAVLVLKELACNAPTLFYVHVTPFLDNICVAVLDPKAQIREGAVEALRSCLGVIADRDKTLRRSWYLKVFEEAQKGLKQATAESIHGSLITIGELLRNTGDFLQTRYQNVYDTVIQYANHRDRLVRRTVIQLLPMLGAYSPERFVANYLDSCINMLLTELRRGSERGIAFLALGELAIVAGDKIDVHMKSIIELIKEGLNAKSRRYCLDAVTCLSMLGRARGETIFTHVLDLLETMFSAGLNQTLTDSLSELTRSIPGLLPHIQQQLMSTIHLILHRAPYRPSNTSGRSFSFSGLAFQQQPQADGTDQSASIILALQTLRTFNFDNQPVIEFVRDCTVNYLDDNNAVIRKEAAVTNSKLLLRPGESVPKRGFTATIVGEVLEKLLVVGISDPDPVIRRTVLSSLDSRFDHFLAQAENLRSLFIALNDEEFEIREVAIEVIGRLTLRNPAYVMPSLRKTLIQLLTELEFSGDSRNKEESARLLGHLIHSAQRLIKPYVVPILKALLPKLRDSNPTVASCVLGTLGELSLVSGQEIMQYKDRLFPLIIEFLQDQSSSSKREVALRTLGQLVESTAYVITPFLQYPKLLNIIIAALQGEQTPSIRRELLKVLGIVGAVDPRKHMLCMTEATKAELSAKKDEGPVADDSIGVSGPSSEDYYPYVAIVALMRILKDQSLSSYHNMVVQAVMFIFKTLGLKFVPFLPHIMPPIMNLIRTCELGLRDFLFQQLGVLVSIVKQHIRKYLDELFSIIQEYWPVPSLQSQILYLVEEISSALKDEFKVYIPDLLPQMLSVLHERGSVAAGLGDRSAPMLKVLHALETFDTNLDDYLHLVIPAVVRLFEQPDAQLCVREAAIQTLGRLCKSMNFSDFASRIIHPLVRVLDGPQVELRKEAMETLCALVYDLGHDYGIFIPLVNKVLVSNRITNTRYDILVSRLLKNKGLPDLQDDDNQPSETDDSMAPDGGPVKKLHVNQDNLKRAWETSQRSTREDWSDWMRRFSVELLRESPSPALRACSALAQVYHPLARELFNAGFVSCWTELFDQFQDSAVRNLETAFSKDKWPHVPPEVLQTLLNLCEFMDHDEKPLPIDIRKLGDISEKCQAYAKALHYKETEFMSSPSTTIQSIIHINNQLNQPEAAIGVLDYAQQTHSVELKESWYEKLGRWEDALEAYEKRLQEEPSQLEPTLGCMRCLNALGEWERLQEVADNTWKSVTEDLQLKVAPLAAAAAWNLGRWDALEEYINKLSETTSDGSFYRAILCIHRNEFEAAERYIDINRTLLDTELTALMGESYNRAYKSVVRAQQLSELEQVIQYKLTDSPERKATISHMWTERLKGCRQHVEVWQRVLAVRSLVIPPTSDAALWLKFTSLCTKSSRLNLSHQTLLTLLAGKTPEEADEARVGFGYFKYLWARGERQEAYSRLNAFAKNIHSNDTSLRARCYHKLGVWHNAMQDGDLDFAAINEMLVSFKLATEYDPSWYKAWHAWALANFQAISYYQKANQSAPSTTNTERLQSHLVPAVQGFFRSISFQMESLQDILRLLTIWFKYGADPKVEQALVDGFVAVSIDTWLDVIPQIIARIHTPCLQIRRLINDLLCRVGKEHPQALIYPVTVASKSLSVPRKEAANSIIDQLRQYCSQLVDQAFLVSQELIRVSILWHEQWHEALEEASRLYFAEHNIEGMLQTLAPLHEMMEKGPDTLREVSFQQAFGRDLQEAQDWCRKYERSRKEADLNQAWDLYYHVFRRINKQLPSMTTLELQYCSPKLLASKDLELAVPGSYKAGTEISYIGYFAPTLSVIVSKQRPRKCAVFASDGKEFVFCLKGHEDLRLDERVMQLFGLVNNLLSNDRHCSKRDLSIQRYSVVPLSPNSGLIGWVANTDTLHGLIREFRDSRKILLNIEHRLMLQMAPDYDNLSLIQKVEVFLYALENTTGQDLNKVLWLKSRNSEVWLDRRTNYTRSLAVMSMVGYILGLGDRHPSNLMLDRISGRLLHIDFGDCFEVAMHRDKFPERVPFRLTRMLIMAMEVSGIEGNFRITSENVMRVLRENKGSVMAMLEAFVHDPIFNWRLLSENAKPLVDKNSADAETKMLLDDEFGAQQGNEAQPVRGGLLNAMAEEDDGPSEEVLNEKAVEVISRIESKLNGKDFGETVLPVNQQVQRLIAQATSHENLCQSYVGWCPFW